MVRPIAGPLINMDFCILFTCVIMNVDINGFWAHKPTSKVAS